MATRSAQAPPYEYGLTRTGRDLLPVIMAVKQWGDRHVSGVVLPPARLRRDFRASDGLHRLR